MKIIERNEIGFDISIEEEHLFKMIKMQIPKSMTVYVVGGWVRDKLLNKQSKDIDLMVWDEDDPLEAAHKFYDILIGKKWTEINALGTVSFNLYGFDIEATPFRRETYSENSNKPEIKVGDFDSEICRRDFTCNSLAMDIDTYEIIDHTYSGIRDIRYRVLNTFRGPYKTFSEDPNRIMRMFRFMATLGFNPHPIVVETIKNEKVLDMLDPSNRGVTPNGVRNTKATSAEENFKQFYKMMVVDEGRLIVNSLNTMKDTGAYAKLSGFPQNFLPLNTPHSNRYHQFDIWTHSMNVLKNIDDNLPDDPDDRFVLRMAALFHDMGKFDPEIRKPHKKINGNFTYARHERSSYRVAKNAFINYILVPDTENRLRSRILRIIKLHGCLLDVNRLRRSKVHQICREVAGPEFRFKQDVDNLITFFYADRKAHKEPLNYENIEKFKRLYLEMGDDLWQDYSWLIDGNDIEKEMSPKADKKFIQRIKDEVIAAFVDKTIFKREDALDMVYYRLKHYHTLKKQDVIVSSEDIIKEFLPFFEKKGAWIKEFVNKARQLERKGLNFDEIMNVLEKETKKEVSSL